MTCTLLANCNVDFISSCVGGKDFCLRLLNDIVLLIFKVCAFHDGPMGSVHPTSSGGKSCFRGFVATFFIALSGPLVVFLFVKLFTHFTFMRRNILIFRRVAKCFTVTTNTLA